MRVNVKVFLLMMGLGLFMMPKLYADDQKSDAQILGIMMTADKDEMDAANQALSKNINNEVKEYARMLLREHTDDFNKLQDLSAKTGIQPSATAGAVEKAKGMKGIATRSVLDGHDFEKTYIDDMVEDHTDDINLIDTDLLKDVKNPELKSAITDARAHMVKHLDRAKELQSKL